VFVQEDGGVCLAERTVRVQARLAGELGATLREECPVDRIGAVGSGVEVVTADGETYRARVAVVTAGPWAADLLASAGIRLPLVPSFEQVTYFRLDRPAPLPTVIDWEADPVHTPYLVPDPTAPGDFKIALHLSGPPVHADERPLDPDPDRVGRVEAYAEERLIGFRSVDRTDTCLYTNTPDEDFVLDRIGPIVIGSPCSGHGFKFTPLIGDLLAELATGEEPSAPLGQFAATRTALRA
jgi:sarcosine oxidase